jgi:hypothetical protein
MIAVIRDEIRGAKNAVVRDGAQSMMTRTVNLARLIFIASLCILLRGCGGGSLGARAVNKWPTDLTIPPEQDVGLMFASGVIPRGTLNALVPFADSTTPVEMSAWNINAPGVTENWVGRWPSRHTDSPKVPHRIFG